MTFPDGPAMFAMLGLHLGDTLGVDGGDLVLACDTVEKRVEWAVDPAILDELEGRRWVEIGEAGPVVTDKGRYWLARWFKRETGHDLSATRIRKRAVTQQGALQ